jgi:ribosome-associated translation inhibitor RaiA|tara:strand:+ start:593 stop:1006 length:414 start_codon:yes stop_codon:yes gene_type:complete
MMVVMKTCGVCKSEFSPTSSQAAAWQDLCSSCYGNRRNTVAMGKLNRSSQNSILSIEKRVADMEDKFSNIELVVEVSAKHTIEPIIEQYEGRLSDIKETVREELKVEMADFVDKAVAKFQRQLVKLNSRIRELEKDD